MDIRVRMAPSPTGFFHIGNAKTALINWLFARKYSGAFILRIEDTDVARSKDEYADLLCEGMRWLGIDWDEGPEFGGEPARGDYGPYRQSQRRDLHIREAQRLLDEAKAYKCFCSLEELEAARERARAEGRPVRYCPKCRCLSPEEVAGKDGLPFSIRFRVPDGVTELEDLVQGTVKVENSEFDDFIIIKPNGDPIFHLAVVVDDGLMKISHVIRGDDHLSNAFRHVMLFNALGYDLPKFAHLPMVLDESGKKYSKRLHGANILDWRADGYLPETLINYLVLLGWTPEEEGRELFSRDELIEAFVIERLGQSAARFDMKKIQWLNGQHIRRLTTEDLCDRLTPILQKAGFDPESKSREWRLQMTHISQEKLRTLNDIVEQTDFFFVDPHDYEPKAVRKQWAGEDAVPTMETIRAMIACTEPFSADRLKAAYEGQAAQAGLSLGKYVHPTRLALTGKSVGPGLFELAELLGREQCLARVERALLYLKSEGVPIRE
jgi:glutamyl-tRNA synthetase